MGHAAKHICGDKFECQGYAQPAYALKLPSMEQLTTWNPSIALASEAWDKLLVCLAASLCAIPAKPNSKEVFCPACMDLFGLMWSSFLSDAGEQGRKKLLPEGGAPHGWIC